MWIKISPNQWQQGDYYITRRKRSGLGGVYYLLERYSKGFSGERPFPIWTIGTFSLLANAKRYADMEAKR